MNADRELLGKALKELVRLRGGSGRPTGFLARLYASALEEWAGRLGVDPPRLERLVLTGEAALDRHP